MILRLAGYFARVILFWGGVWIQGRVGLGIAVFFDGVVGIVIWLDGTLL